MFYKSIAFTTLLILNYKNNINIYHILLLLIVESISTYCDKNVIMYKLYSQYRHNK